MKFTINSDEWIIKLVSKNTILEKYKTEFEETPYCFGLTLYPIHEIWLNKEMCEEQLIKTLKHELTHCYIWEFGFSQLPNFTEEIVCDLVMSSNDFINNIISNFRKERRNTKMPVGKEKGRI